VCLTAGLEGMEILASTRICVFPGWVGEVQGFVTAVAVVWCHRRPIKIQPWFLVPDLYFVL